MDSFTLLAYVLIQFLLPVIFLRLATKIVCRFTPTVGTTFSAAFLSMVFSAFVFSSVCSLTGAGDSEKGGVVAHRVNLIGMAFAYASAFLASAYVFGKFLRKAAEAKPDVTAISAAGSYSQVLKKAEAGVPIGLRAGVLVSLVLLGIGLVFGLLISAVFWLAGRFA